MSQVILWDQKSGEMVMERNQLTDRKEPSLRAARIPPHHTEAEESVLGAVLIDNQAIDLISDRLRKEDFYHGRNQAIYGGMIELAEKREPIDVVTLGDELRRQGVLEQCGGLENLSRLTSVVPSAANIVHYARFVRDASLRRRIIHEATEVITEAYRAEEDVNEFLDHAESRILGVAETRADQSLRRVGEIVQDSIKLIEDLHQRKELVTGLHTGFEKLNAMTAGFQPSELIIIAARPSMGKTALALCIAQRAALDHGNAVAIFSLEMSREALVMRMLCSEARVDHSKVRTGHLGERDFPVLVNAAGVIADSKIFIDDTPALTAGDLRAKARRLHREQPLSLIVVDYLQLLRSPTYAKSREQEISDISRSLKSLAKELRVPVVALSQLNRSVESRTDKRPVMSDLRESGAIEQDADIIAFIYRDEVYNENSPDKGIAELIIGKQRNGPTGRIRLFFSPEFTRFDNLEEQRDEYFETSIKGEAEFSGPESDLF